MAEAAGRDRVAALTGATGFLGRHVAGELLARGWHVRALARPGRDVPFGLEAAAGDLGDAEALERLVSGADAVVHCAGLTQARQAAEFQEINAGGTARLFERTGKFAANAQVVHVSSLAAREPHLSAYAASKAASETEARRHIAAHRLAIVRPPALYGPHDRQTLSVFRAARLPLAPLPGAGRERIALCEVRDAAWAVAELLENRASGLFALADGHSSGYTLREILAQAAIAQGRHARFVPVPPVVLKGFGIASAALGRMLRRPVLLSPDKLRELLHEDWSVDSRDMPPGLADRAKGIAQGFAETVAWYRQADWL